MNSSVVGALLWNLMSAIKRCPVSSSCETLSNILLTSSKLAGCSCFFIHPYRIGLVMTCLYWLFSSIFNIFVEIHFVCFFPSMSKSNNTFSFLLSLRRISVSKANLVFTQLNSPISVFSKTLTYSASVRRAIRHLIWSLWAQPLNELAELHLREFYLKCFWSYSDRCS